MVRRPPALHAWLPLRAGLLLAALSTLLALPGCDDPAAPELSGDNLLELVTDADDLTILRAILADLALAGPLRSGDDLTFFAPTDEALLSLGADMISQLRLPNNEAVLDKLLRRHLVPGRFRTADLRDGMTLEPLAGPPLAVRVEGEDIRVGGALLVEDGVATGNGVLHRVDDLARDHLTLEERLRVTPIVEVFADALETARLTESVTEDGPFTLFIPINSAFTTLPPVELQALLSSANRDVLTKVLRHHVVPGRVRLEELETGDALAALDGTPLGVVAEGGLTYVGGARVIVPEVETSDGLIYLLDTVVLNHLDIRDRMQIVPEFFTSFSILRDAGVFDQMDPDGSYTVFAPTEASWDVLGLPFLPELRALPDLLLRTAQYFVAQGRLDREALLDGGTLTTLGGYDLPLTVSQDVGGPQVYVGGRGEVNAPPREASNGLIYTVAPFYYPPDMNLEERAVFTALYRFLNLMERAGLTSLLREPGPYTVFAPVDDALEGVGIPDSRLPDLMRYHIVPGRFTAQDLTTTAKLTTLEGHDIQVLAGRIIGLNCVIEEEPPALICEAEVSSANNAAENGVIHTIDGLLEIPTP